MKRFSFLVLLVSMFSLTGCFDVVEEISLNKDGSGIFSLNFDMSALMQDEMMKGMFKQAIEQQDSLKISMDGKSMEVDTIMAFKDSPMAKNASEFPEFMQKATMQMQVSEKDAKMVMTMKLPFEKVDQVGEFFETLAKLSPADGAGGGMLGGGGGMPFASQAAFALSGRTLTRKPSKLGGETMNDENMQMMKMFLANATYRVIYNLPGKVKKTTIPGAVVDGKKVTVRKPLLEIAEGKAKMDGDIKFKKK